MNDQELREKMESVINELDDTLKSNEAPDYAKVKAATALGTAIKRYKDMFDTTPDKKSVRSIKNY